MRKLLTNEEAIEKILKEQFNDTEINLWALVELETFGVDYDSDGEELPCTINCVYINPEDKLVHVCDAEYDPDDDFIFRELNVSDQRKIVWMVRKTWEECNRI